MTALEISSDQLAIFRKKTGRHTGLVICDSHIGLGQDREECLRGTCKDSPWLGLYDLEGGEG